MLQYLIRRTLILVCGLFLSSLIIFLVLRLLPGDLAQIMGGTEASQEKIAQLRQKLGLNVPLWTQYVDWISAVIRGDFGSSLVSGTPVSKEILQKASVTVPLALLSLAFALLIAFPLGVFAAYRNQGWTTSTISSFSTVAAATPVVWAGLIIVLIFSNWLGWFPSQGFPRVGWEEPFAALRALFLPALTVGLIEGGVLFRFVRSATFSALNTDHVRTGMSFGYTRFQALIRNGLPSVGLSLVSGGR